MKITVNVSIGDKTYTIIQDVGDDWKTANKPSAFRRKNPKRLDELSRLLESVGLVVMQHAFPDINEPFYHAYFHPMMSTGLLKLIPPHALEDKDG